MNYREQWYHDRGLPYEPPKLDCPPPWQCIGGSVGGIKLPEKKLRPPVRSHHEPREPGEDTPEDIGYAA